MNTRIRKVQVLEINQRGVGVADNTTPTYGFPTNQKMK